MKKTLTAITLLAGAVAGYSQGAVTWQGYAGSQQQVIYNVSTGAGATNIVADGQYSVTEVMGSSGAANENPTGPTVYSGAPLSGTGFDAEFYGAAGLNQSYSALTGISTVEHFNTGASSIGLTKGDLTVTVPTDANGNSTVAIAAWQSTGTAGAATTLAAAQADGYAWGFSSEANVVPTTGSTPPLTLPTIPSFSLGVPTPEPSTIALGVMGASALLFRRRK